ncbi:type I-E CRISPR-associated protein Cas5/CasD [Rhodobacter capsulatus]|uniref:CRISPR system Cascade subunit CasD n=1 Tax=Rhodobacter capsulatus TaxID=1061 RepID=A0A1G7NB11_RHOCA|nr:type I-E CRISPR-associated protein Cas5/CasD [Rhodobacter capsulatus]WER08201.1 type I-E CRISPR-associated protein Cas5/CasD [Rhodobacter capsulatus]SDF71101.1 CRISPR system Cascade subunit CasD [Rhodobacter capsulatus]
MQPFLIFGLSASLAAMGELAGHERRGSLIWPGRSAILGLLGAALGIRRMGDFTALDALDVSVAIFDAGAPLRDYHTIESVPSAAAKRPNSRPEALRDAKGRTNTTITLRDYRAGVFYGVAVQGAGLEALQAALSHPRFTLYLGRKSCPLSAPPGARIVQAGSPAQALIHLTPPPWLCERGGPVARTLIVGADQGEVIHDRALDRRLWHFGPRSVARQPVEIALEATP